MRDKDHVKIHKCPSGAYILTKYPFICNPLLSVIPHTITTILGQIGAVDKIPFPPNYATIRGKGGGGMQLKFHTVTIEDLMPQDHFLRR